MLRVGFTLIIVVSLAACTTPGDDWLVPVDGGATPTDTTTTDTDPVPPVVPEEIEAIAQKYCSGGGCHDAVAPTFTDNIALLLEPTTGSYAGCAGTTAAECSLLRMKDGSMPLGKLCMEPSPTDPSACPTPEEIQTFEDWVNGGGPSDAPDYTTEVAPILDSYCGGCHANTAPAFTGDPTTLDGTPPGSYGCTGTVPECIETVIASGDMPLGGGCSAGEDTAGCPTQAERDVISAWVAAGAPR